MPEYIAPDEISMISLGSSMAESLSPGTVIFLDGELGAGKTTLARGIIGGLGHCGTVTSPTYTLVEPYQCRGVPVYHFDLYRLENPEELETIGFRDMIHGNSICLVEWPERGHGILPKADITINITYNGAGRIVKVGDNV
jgi:tRNA threonylcarbamoyladenosine biosynthesis protein TsaE